MSLYQAIWYFLIYSFFGWVLEVIYHAVTQGRVVNRGFLNGPVCPVYGIGVDGVFALNTYLPHNEGGDVPAWLVFVGGVILATLVELIAGWLLDVLFHARWWDYTGKPFNLHGYICAEFSLLWGLAIVLVVKVLQPYLETHSANLIPERYGWPMIGILGSVYLADLIVTVLIVKGMNKRLAELDEIREKMRVVSGHLSQQIGENTIAVARHVDEGRVQAALARDQLRDDVAQSRAEYHEMAAQVRSDLAEVRKDLHESTAKARQKRREEQAKARQQRLQSLQARREELVGALLRPRIFGAGRLLRAFPEMKHREHHELIGKLKERMEERNGKI